MGWLRKTDYLLFTIVIVPKEYVIQKFHLYEESFSAKNPPHRAYFYGIKGSSDDQIVGQFVSDYDGVTFEATQIKKDYSYGLVFLPFMIEDSYIDDRLHPKPYQKRIASEIAIFGAVAIVGIFLFFRFYKKA